MCKFSLTVETNGIITIESCMFAYGMGLDKSNKKVIIIGGGIAGLAASIRLAKSGFNIQLIETNDQVGGNIRELQAGGFRFDMGPSILTKPEYLKELFLLWDKNPDDYIRFSKVEPLFRYFFPDGSFIDSYSDRKKFEEELKQKSGESFSHVNKHLNDSGEIFKLTHEVFLERSLHELKNYFNWPTLRGILRFNRVHAFQSMHHYNRKIFKDQRLVQLFNRYASYNGSNPFEAPATLNVITHFAINSGSFLPEGGMINISKALQKLAEEAGVKFMLKNPALKICIKNKKVTGVETEAGLLPADAVLSNADVHYTYQKLLPGISMPSIVEKQLRSSSVIVFYWGINKVFPSLELHNTFFGKSDKLEFDALFKEETICDDPTVYLFNSSMMNPGDAPEGKSNWFVMITAPFDHGQDWNKITGELKKNVLKKISGILNENVEALITSENILTPPMIEQKTNAWMGSIYGNSSNGIFSAFLRHPNFSRKIKGLYFCGGSVHPGAGIPLCLLSAKIASDLIVRRSR
ncbi:phytoene desaturase family protein [soil metagenome]